MSRASDSSRSAARGSKTVPAPSQRRANAYDSETVKESEMPGRRGKERAGKARRRRVFASNTRRSRNAAGAFLGVHDGRLRFLHGLSEQRLHLLGDVGNLTAVLVLDRLPHAAV